MNTEKYRDHCTETQTSPAITTILPMPLGYIRAVLFYHNHTLHPLGYVRVVLALSGWFCGASRVDDTDYYFVFI